MNRYPFCLFRIPENGGRVLWEITNTCNYHCSYCIFSSETIKYENELTTDEVKRTIKELSKRDVYISLLTHIFHIQYHLSYP